ncbi:AraC family transcriptional regulator [Nocardiopsis sp. EMB25]|uniref:AraC family transcriptional regulator n=1 Tax=Nocardiopsis TaxID=2013 RepID=UPI00034B16D8|nr:MULTISPECIES: AraC family transcriptional regulator [Nocardiopsis]MCY9784611.1 AraC family transcriptional regulator [Nocardiopsis sp. EMB25]
MDVLSDVVGTIRSGQPRAARVEWHSPWGMRFPEVSGAGFQVVLQGSAWLRAEGVDPLRLGVGDVVFLPHGHGYALSDRPDAPIDELSCVSALDGRRNGAPVGEFVCDARGARPHPRFDSTALGSPDGDPPSCVTVGGAYKTHASRPHPMLVELPRVVHLPARVGQHPELTSAVELLGRELDTSHHGVDTVVPALLDILLMYILRAFLEEHRPEAACGWIGALRDPAVGAAVRAVHGDPAHPWTVAELGERAGLSRAAFSRRFTAMVGQAPLAYVTWWRLTRARALLQETDAPISAIAARVGYGSQFAFANAFKREFGTSPGRYRSGVADAS